MPVLIVAVVVLGWIVVDYVRHREPTLAYAAMKAGLGLAGIAVLLTLR